MRNKKRMPIILSNFDIWIQDFLVQNTELAVIEIDEIISRLALVKNKINSVWKKNYDMRFGQLLINFFGVPESGRLWYVEEVDWLIDNEYVKVEDICFWGVNYKKDGTLRKYRKQVLLKDLKTDHIANILSFVERNGGRIIPSYEKYFKERLNIT